MPKSIRTLVTECWRSWKNCSRTVTEVREERDAIGNLSAASINVSVDRASKAAGIPIKSSPSILRNAELLKGKGESINPTLLSGSGLHYKMYQSSIFHALDMRSVVRGNAANLHAAATTLLSSKAPRVGKSLRSGGARISIVPGDLTQALHYESNVDLIDMSNALDYISKEACLLAATQFLPRLGGVVSLHTMMAPLDVGSSKTVLKTADLNQVASLLGAREVVQGQLGCSVTDGALWEFKMIPMNEYDISLRKALDTTAGWYSGPLSM